MGEMSLGLASTLFVRGKEQETKKCRKSGDDLLSILVPLSFRILMGREVCLLVAGALPFTGTTHTKENKSDFQIMAVSGIVFSEKEESAKTKMTMSFIVNYEDRVPPSFLSPRPSFSATVLL